MKIYVAGKWEDRNTCRGLMVNLRILGHEITRDWTVRRQEEKDDVIALQDAEAVQAADAIVIVAIKELDYRGAYAELGMAIALNKAIALIGSGFNECIFSSLASIRRYSSIADFLEDESFLLRNNAE